MMRRPRPLCAFFSSRRTVSLPPSRRIRVVLRPPRSHSTLPPGPAARLLRREHQRAQPGVLQRHARRHHPLRVRRVQHTAVLAPRGRRACEQRARRLALPHSPLLLVLTVCVRYRSAASPSPPTCGRWCTSTPRSSAIGRCFCISRPRRSTGRRWPPRRRSPIHDSTRSTTPRVGSWLPRSPPHRMCRPRVTSSYRRPRVNWASSMHPMTRPHQPP